VISDPADIATFIDRLRVDLDELKNAQRIGYDSLLTYKTASDGSYDISDTLTASQVKEYDITLTHDQAANGALIVMNPYWRLNNSAVMASPLPREVQNSDVSWTKIQSNGGTTVWRLRIVNSFSISTTYYVKLFFDGTDTGTFIVTPV
jgi:hypothetical protein